MSMVSTTSLLTRGLGGVAFINKLEKHLDDHRRGRGYLSSGTGSEVKKQHISNRDLAPSHLSLYSGYSTFLGYGSKAYFAHSVHEVRRTVKLIESAPAQAEKATENLKKTLGYA
ncbi:MAG: hypothetical protein J5J00_16065 [Deltaproteobacteria bacterium]|nr:hypothetical protein [Deltaproteobacteria bacterium]